MDPPAPQPRTDDETQAFLEEIILFLSDRWDIAH